MASASMAPLRELSELPSEVSERADNECLLEGIDLAESPRTPRLRLPRPVDSCNSWRYSLAAAMLLASVMGVNHIWKRGTADERAHTSMLRHAESKADPTGMTQVMPAAGVTYGGLPQPSRECVDLPGAKLKGSDAKDFGLANLTTAEKCRAACKAHVGCAQSVFTNELGPECKLFSELSTEPTAFGDYYNSSYCGTIAEQDDLLAKLKKVFKAKPWVPANPNCAWSGKDCSESKCCADVPKCDYMFQSCQWYTCYKKDEYFSGCLPNSAPYGWNGTKLGGHSPMDVPKAKPGIVIQGTRLFCFSVVMWDAGPTMQGMDSESAVANNMKNMGRGIMQCDEHAWFDGQPTGSVHNIDPFIAAWNMVKKDGRWKRNDWTVKVDADAVFFPERLRWHVESLRPPMGSAVYLRNINFKFHFLGALEVLSREAVATYFERGWECEKQLTKEGGEDYWMLQCLEGIGVNYISDYRLLNDKYAAMENCNDDWAVAFHFYKKVDDWNWCWQAAQNAWEAKHTTVTTTSAPKKVQTKVLKL